MQHTKGIVNGYFLITLYKMNSTNNVLSRTRCKKLRYTFYFQSINAVSKSFYSVKFKNLKVVLKLRVLKPDLNL